MKHTRLAAVIGTAITAAGLAAIAGCGATARGPAAAAAPASPAYSYYRSMMGRLSGGPAGSMMGGTSNGWMMGGTGYRWMMGGQAAAPAWMRGHALPGFMTGTSHDPGKIRGQLWANAPDPRVSPAQAARLSSMIPAGATISRAQHRITFTGATARITVVASPAGGPDERFRAAGMTDPAIVVKAGARVIIQVVNADHDTAHGLVITASGTRSGWMPMMTARPAFTGSAVWFLGNPTAAGLHAATLTFTAETPGAYRYLCPVPGHAQKGMTGTFTVSSAT